MRNDTSVSVTPIGRGSEGVCRSRRESKGNGNPIKHGIPPLYWINKYMVRVGPLGAGARTNVMKEDNIFLSTSPGDTYAYFEFKLRLCI